MTQKEALDILKLGHNVYLTGPAGSGKTYLLNQYIDYLREHKIPVGITASTGIASTHMGGTTIHSWSGMGIRDTLTDKDLEDLLKRPYLRNRFRQAKVLIIDEISMLHAYQLDIVHEICSAFKGKDAPFGGLQVIMCGDFFQLPPVKKAAKLQSFTDANGANHSAALPLGNSETKSDFVTSSSIWNKMNVKICYLDEQFRQDDRALLRILNDIRNNEVNEMTVEYLSERLNKETKGYTKPTRLFTHNADVDAINLQHLKELDGESHEYFMTSRGSLGLMETLRRSCLAPEKLILRKGAQVMFVKNNYEDGYVNGTLGEVIDFTESGSPKVRTFEGAEITVTQMSWEVRENDQELASIAQIPLRLAWAITVHKSQGMSLDAAEIDLSRSFIPGMGYVALSRVRSLTGLKLMGMNQMALQINQDVAEMDRDFRKSSDDIMLTLHGMEREKIQQKQGDYLQILKTH